MLIRNSDRIFVELVYHELHSWPIVAISSRWQNLRRTRRI